MRYHETQRFTSPWAWAAILGGTGVVWYGAWEQLVQGRPFGSDPAPDGWLVVIWLLVGVGMPGLFGAARLHTDVREDGVRIRLTPFHWRGQHWTFDQIAEAYPRDYGPIREYGGWGIRLGLGGKGRAYNMKGTRGVQLVLRDGSRVLIGSQHADRLAAAIQAGMGR